MLGTALRGSFQNGKLKTPAIAFEASIKIPVSERIGIGSIRARPGEFSVGDAKREEGCSECADKQSGGFHWFFRGLQI